MVRDDLFKFKQLSHASILQIDAAVPEDVLYNNDLRHVYIFRQHTWSSVTELTPFQGTKLCQVHRDNSRVREENRKL